MHSLSLFGLESINFHKPFPAKEKFVLVQKEQVLCLHFVLSKVVRLKRYLFSTKATAAR